MNCTGGWRKGEPRIVMSYTQKIITVIFYIEIFFLAKQSSFYEIFSNSYNNLIFQYIIKEKELHHKIKIRANIKILIF